MSTTSDRNHPDINIPEAPGKQNKVYLVLSEDERAKGFVRPVRGSYFHTTCETVTTMGKSIAETYAREPSYYRSTWCCACCAHFPVSQFRWLDGEVLGS
jgi:hypothetical protein